MEKLDNAELLERRTHLLKQLADLRKQLAAANLLTLVFWWAQCAPLSQLNRHHPEDTPARIGDCYHMLRDGYSVTYILPILLELGFDYGGILPNLKPKHYKRDGSGNVRKVTMTIPHPQSQYFYLHPTRPQLDDRPKHRQLVRTGSEFERVALGKEGLRMFFETCSRSHIVLSEEVDRYFGQPGYDNGSDTRYRALEFEESGSPYIIKGAKVMRADFMGGTDNAIDLETPSTMGYIAFIPQMKDFDGNERGSLLSIWSQSGTASLLWSYLVAFGSLDDQTPLRDLLKGTIEAKRKRLIGCLFNPVFPADGDLPGDLLSVNVGKVEKKIDVFLK